MSHVIEVSPNEAKIIIETHGPILLDTRDTHSYKEQHIDGAMLAHDSLTESLIKKKDYNRSIIVYCYQGISSKDLAELLSKVGFKSVYSLKGGFTAWKSTFLENSVTTDTQDKAGQVS
jgi:rhodanese-related sulfurtransferase